MAFDFPAASPPVDPVGIQERAARITRRSIKADAKREGLERILSLIDLTTLEGADTPGKVRQLCRKARQLHSGYPQLPTVAAVCVYPALVPIAREALEGTEIKIASVATTFPAGQSDLAVKLDDVQRAIDSGADEIDMVLSRGRLLAGDERYVFDEVCRVRELCQGVGLKVILETGELGSLDCVRRASDLALAGGADFIKTSTGKIKPAATLPVTLVMLYAIRDHFLATGKAIGMKPAGGISSAKLALHYLALVKEVLGAEWLVSDRFRFGASSLANDVLMQWVRMETGQYQSPRYFSAD